ncbi:MAG: hypothetical protein ACFFFG_01945 [Candidatus Thorarchaeota archaeon]
MSSQNQITENPYLKYSWKGLIIMGIIMVGESLLQISSAFLGNNEFIENYTGVNWNQYAAAYPEMADYLLMIGLQFGVLLGVVGLFGCVIAWKGFKKHEKWAWYTMWLFPISFGLISLIFFVSINNMLIAWVSSAIFSLITAIIVLLPYQAFFPSTT